jgi:hypothetical protein
LCRQCRGIYSPGNFGATAKRGAIRETGGVAESATCAMMLFGFAGIGSATKRPEKWI